MLTIKKSREEEEIKIFDIPPVYETRIQPFVLMLFFR